MHCGKPTEGIWSSMKRSLANLTKQGINQLTATGSDTCSTGPPSDFEDDLELPVWAGVLPLRVTAGAAETDPALTNGVPLPRYVARYRRPER